MFKNYYQARDWLEEFIPLVYGKEEFGLSRIQRLLKLLGNPERKFKSIHIAGTSGKGSTAFYTARLLQEAGLKVGLHVSPHLVDIRERMQIFESLESGVESRGLMPISKFLRLFNGIKPIVESMMGSKVGLPSYFEILVAVTFKYFADEKVDFAVVEVGLGGRLDATNVLTPKLSVITNIGLDHTEILGKTIEKIASEKAGIIKAGVPVLTGASGKGLGVIEKVARDKGAKLVKVSTQKGPAGNQFLAKTALEILRIRVSGASMKKAYEVGFAGRFEEIEKGVVLDGAHNADKVKALINWTLDNKGAKRIILVVAFKKGKNWKKMVDLLVNNLPVDQVISTEFNAVTDTGKFAAVPAEKIARYVSSSKYYVVSVKTIKNSQEAVFEALQSKIYNPKSEILLTSGSLYLVGEVRTMWKLPEF